MVELAQSRRPEAAEIVHHRTPPFPRAVRTFTGRQKELSRALSLLETEVLFLVYGVSGIGKSEFVYKLIEQARATPPWDGAQLILVTVGEDHRAENLTAFLRLHTGLLRAHDTALDAGLLASRAPSVQDDLAEIVAALNARPFLVFIDDLHNLDTATAARLLCYLSRYVQRSRIFAASRLEIPLPLDTSPPVVTRLPALDPSESVALVDRIAYRLGVPVPDGRAISQRARGNPDIRELLESSEAAPLVIWPLPSSDHWIGSHSASGSRIQSNARAACTTSIRVPSSVSQPSVRAVRSRTVSAGA